MAARELGQIAPRPPLKETVFDNVRYVCPSWEQMGEYAFDLARQIHQDGRHFDRIVALAKGGWTWARTMADYLDVDPLSSMRIKSYSGVNEAGRPRIIQPLADAIDGEDILLFDEVVDSGVSIERAEEVCRAMGAKSVTVAALCHKPHASVTPDFVAFQTEAWVVFPHELREFVADSTRSWQAAGKSEEEIITRLVAIGVPEEQARYFVDLEQEKSARR